MRCNRTDKTGVNIIWCCSVDQILSDCCKDTDYKHIARAASWNFTRRHAYRCIGKQLRCMLITITAVRSSTQELALSELISITY